LLGMTAAAHAQTPPASPGAETPVDDATSCMRAHEAGQEQQQRGELLAARATYRGCSSAACPEVVRDQCVLQIEELATLQPTIVLAARDARGRDTTAVVASVDGRRLADRLAGLAIPLDPGHHVLRFQSGSAVREVSIVLSVGEKNRKVLADFYVPPPAPTRDAAVGDAPSSGVPTATWVFGGVGLAALASFVTWGLVGRSQEDKLDKCRATRTCPEGKVDAMYRSYTAADISLGIGVLAVGAAALTYALAPRAKKSAVARALGIDRARREQPVDLGARDIRGAIARPAPR